MPDVAVSALDKVGKMDPAAAFEQNRQEQLSSPFFNYFPGEVRDKIFTFVLNCYENPKKLWDKNTPYVRPGYNAAQVADTALLRTCQRIYAESKSSVARK